MFDTTFIVLQNNVIVKENKHIMHNEHFNRKKVQLVMEVAFVLGFLDAFLIYILSSYFSRLIGSDNVGIFYLVAYSGVLASLFYLQPLIRIIGKARALYLFLGLTIFASVFLTRMDISWMAVGLVLLFIITTNVIWVVLDILLEGFSKDRLSGRIRGLHLTILNAGLLAAPFLSTLALERFGYEGIFFILVVGYIIVFLITLIGFRSDNVVFQQRLRLRQTLRKMLLDKNLSRIYFISFAMEFFYAMMIVYMPLYLLSIGFSWHTIGIIFTFMLIPFVILQYPLGILADRRFGEKELLFGSIFIVFVATSIIGFLDTQSLWIWGSVLFFSRVGIAGIEVLRDSYFYKQIDGDGMDVIAFFRTTRPLANIVGAVLSALIFIIFPLKSIFFMVALVLFASLFTAFRLEDTKSEREALS
ncbi:MAG: MFS transporter [bacterium]|nr:MFS transporter [bacterium]